MPCVLVLPVEQGNPDYLAWVVSSTGAARLSASSCQRGGNHYDTITPTRGAFGSVPTTRRSDATHEPSPRTAPWACSAPPPSSPYPLTQVAQASASGTYENSVYANTNIQRAKNDRVKLKGAKCLDKFAERQAAKMADERRMYHQQLGPILKACNLSTVGENVAYGYSNGKAAVSAWMKSPGHKANILNTDYRLIAVGAAQDKDGRWYVAQVFGRSA